MKCAVVGCKNYTETTKKDEHGITFHLFPSEPDLRKAWIQALNRGKWTPSNYSKVCSEHFLESDFYMTKMGRKKLQEGTIVKPFLRNQNKAVDKVRLVKCCQICLETDVLLYSLRSRQLQSYLKSVLANLTKIPNELPQLICYICARELEKCYKFLQKSMASHQILSNLRQLNLITDDIIRENKNQNPNLGSPLVCENITSKNVYLYTYDENRNKSVIQNERNTNETTSNIEIVSVKIEPMDVENLNEAKLQNYEEEIELRHIKFNDETLLERQQTAEDPIKLTGIKEEIGDSQVEIYIENALNTPKFPNIKNENSNHNSVAENSKSFIKSEKNKNLKNESNKTVIKHRILKSNDGQLNSDDDNKKNESDFSENDVSDSDDAMKTDSDESIEPKTKTPKLDQTKDVTTSSTQRLKIPVFKKTKVQRKSIKVLPRSSLKPKFTQETVAAELRSLKEAFQITDLSLEDMKALWAENPEIDRSAAYSCDICFVNCRTFTVYLSHMGEHTPLHGSEMCEICELRFPTKTDLEIHLTVTHSKSYCCKTCGDVFSKMDAAKSHRPNCVKKAVSGINENKLMSGVPGVTYACDRCERSFDTILQRVEHVQQHVNKTVKYRCKMCTQAFSTMETFKDHLKNMHNIRHNKNESKR